MFEQIKVDPELADAVNKEMHSIRVDWTYYSMTTDYYNKVNSDKIRGDIDAINVKYGPVIDTQRFTQEIYNLDQPKYTSKGIKGFIDIRSDPKSLYNRNFPSVAKLVDHLQLTYIPKNYKVVRLMFNMQTKRPEWAMNAPHPDFHNKDYITILYYVNDSDGDTYFFEGQECVNRVAPVKGTAAMYPSCMMHAGSTPVKSETRVVINMCFGPK